MSCPGCERRRKEMALMVEASKQWMRNPAGPNVHEVLMRLRLEAIQKGELDVSVEPSED